VTVIFSTIFKDDDDVVIGKVFMQVSVLGLAFCQTKVSPLLLLEYVSMLSTIMMCITYELILINQDYHND